MWARARSQAGFTTVELLIAMMIGSVGMISLIGTFDVSRRVTTLLGDEGGGLARRRAGDGGDAGARLRRARAERQPVAGELERPEQPGLLRRAAASYRWDQRSNAPAGHTEPLVIDATDGEVARGRGAWNDGRLKGKIYRYVTCAATTAADCDQGPDTSAYKRITVAVTVENALGPQKPILVSTLVGNPDNRERRGREPARVAEHAVRGRRRRRRGVHRGGDGDREHLVPVRHAGHVLGARGDRRAAMRRTRRSPRAVRAPAARPAAARCRT